jgi:hypothetical protein
VGDWIHADISDEYHSYTGEKLLKQKSGYMLASTAAMRLVPGSQAQPLHRVSDSILHAAPVCH